MMYRTLLAVSISSCLLAHLPTEQQAYNHRKVLNQQVAPQCTTIPEGGFVYFFNSSVLPYIQKPLDKKKIADLQSFLKPHLEIPITREGFTMASTRRSEDELDETSYSAIWVRDTCWHYFGLAETDPTAAKKLLLHLLKFYSTPNQIERFRNVIENPSLADPEKNPNARMSVPLIRFSRKTLSHFQVNGKDQEWNHLQFDSHGIFLIALTQAFETGIISPRDITPKMAEVLSLFPAFFEQTRYWEHKDAGPWEEELMNNACTIGLVAAGIRNFSNLLQNNKNFSAQIRSAAKPASLASSLEPKALNALYEKGLKKVEFNLSLGCEAPDLDGSGNHRRADAALLFLCYPKGSLFYDNKEKIQEILNITLSLVGPYGVYRYKYDAYQSQNYWIDHNLPSAIMGPKTVDFEILTRFNKGYMPANQPYDAQWFFDSIFAAVYYRLSTLEHNATIRAYDKQRGDIHLKRALGQLTGEHAIAANGESLPPMSLPESINTVFDQQYPHRALPSPICPLTWSIATMRLALKEAQLAH